MSWRLPLSDLALGQEEVDAVQAVLRSGWLSMGEVTQRFEREFAAYLGVRHAVAVSSATAALHLANAALGLGPGDEVIVPALTFVATANAVLYTGATPVFADITAEDDLGISPGAIEAAITPATRAIVVMHYGGYMCDMAAIGALARRHRLAVIEDAAHAPGSSLAGMMAGSLGDAGCFSFYANKNLVTGEGGMIVTDRDDLAERIRLMRSHGMTTLTWDRHRGHAHSYDVVALGYNYRLDEMRAALGLTQLAGLERNNARRKALTAEYGACLDKVPGLSLPYRSHRGTSAAHLLPIVLHPDRDRGRFMAALRERGIQTSVHYPPVHRFTYYRERFPSVSLPLTEAVAAREVTLPLYPHMTSEDVRLVARAVEEALAQAEGCPS